MKKIQQRVFRNSLLQQVSILKVHIAIITKCTKLCKQLSKRLFKCPEPHCVLRCNGSEFQSEGPAYEIAHRLKCSRLILGMTTRAWSAERRLR